MRGGRACQSPGSGRHRSECWSLDAPHTTLEDSRRQGVAALSAASENARRTFLLRNRDPEGDLIAMRYFTPNLFVRLQNLQDRTASEEWERAVEKYDTYLRGIRPRLPRSLRRIVEELYLHDADVLCMSRRGNTLSITLQLEPPAESLLVLDYSLVADPEINH